MRIKEAPPNTKTASEMKIHLAQRGRALIDFEAGLRLHASALHREAEAVLAERGVTAATLPEDMDERHMMIAATLRDYKPFQVRGLLGEWSAKEHGKVCEEAYAEVRDTLAPVLQGLEAGGTTITQSPDHIAPRYWSEVWFHRTTGGWDASPANGLVHGELVHKRYVSKIFPGDIYTMRRQVLNLLPRHDYARILELGTSSGHYTVALAERFPSAELTGVDLSRSMLEQARRVGNEMACAWDLHVAAGEDTGFPDCRFDLVTSYAIHHELPPRIITRWFKEAFRMLRPGGDLLMVDVPRYADLDRLEAWRFDYAAKWGGEPFWRPSAMMDLAEAARDAGFSDVRSGGLPPGGNPYYVYGRRNS